MPVPDNATVTGVLLALLPNDSVAVAVPTAFGLKFKLKVTLVPAAIVSGNVNPLVVNSELDEVAEETATLAPVALRVNDLLELTPTTVFPKLIDVWLAASCPWLVPDPDRGMLKLEPLVVTARDPLLGPEAFGENETVNVAL